MFVCLRAGVHVWVSVCARACARVYVVVAFAGSSRRRAFPRLLIRFTNFLMDSGMSVGETGRGGFMSPTALLRLL